MWFQQDGITCHTTRAYLHISCCIISRRDDINQDHAILCGFAKNHVYADKRSTLEHLKTNIRQFMAEIPPNMCQKVVESYLKKSMLATIHMEVIHNVVNVQTFQ